MTKNSLPCLLDSTKESVARCLCADQVLEIRPRGSRAFALCNQQPHLSLPVDGQFLQAEASFAAFRLDPFQFVPDDTSRIGLVTSAYPARIGIPGLAVLGWKKGRQEDGIARSVACERVQHLSNPLS
jgi:hypothetical protein